MGRTQLLQVTRAGCALAAAAPQASGSRRRALACDCGLTLRLGKLARTCIIIQAAPLPLPCSYGRGRERGAARPEVLQSLLATTERVVQEVDSVEYGLTDIQVRRADTRWCTELGGKVPWPQPAQAA